MLILTILIALYVAILLVLWHSWNQLPIAPTQKPSDYVRFSVVVAARNEAENIVFLLQSLNALNYPRTHFEVIVINDHSTDQTAALVAKFEANYALRCLQAEQQGKKNALSQGVCHAQGDYIITTDADCQVPADWLLAFCHIILSQSAKFIAAPVSFYRAQGLFQAMQTIELASLVGVAGATVQLGKPTMCNGANVCYEKQAFFAVKGYEGNEQIASGDDVFLMHKIAQHYPNSVRFVKGSSVTVYTQPMPTWRDFFHQRLRWANKWNSYQNKVVSGLAVVVFAFHLGWVGGIAYGLLQKKIVALLPLLLKAASEYLFLQQVLKDSGKKCKTWAFVALQGLYSFYVIFFGIAVHFRLKFIWKKRNFAK